MELHPGQDKRYVPEERAVELDPIRRALQENEDWNRDLVQHSRDLLCIHDLQGRLLSVNPAPARVLGYTVEELLQIPLREIIAPEFRTQFDAYLSQMERTGEASGLMAVITRTGEQRIWEYHNTLRTEGVAVPIVRGMAHDVTERIRAERALHQREADLNRAQAVAHIGSWSYDIRNHSVALTDETYRILGLPVGSLLTPEARMDVIHPDDRARVRSGWEAALKGGHYDLEHRVLVHGSARWVETKADVEFNGEGRPVAAVGTVQDITDRKGAEESLRESELRFRTVYERSPVGIALVDPLSGQFLQANPKFCEITGRSEEELLRTDVAGITHPDDIERSNEFIRQTIEGGLTDFEIRKRFTRADGSVRCVRILVAPLWRRGGRQRWNMALVEDITERRQAEEAIRQSEERFRVALKNSPIAMFNQDRDLRYTWIYNPQVPGLARGHLGKTPCEFFGPEEGQRIEEIRRRVLESGVGVRHEMQITDQGRKHYFDTTIEPFLDSTGAVIGLTGASTDVTELRETSEALREAKEKLAEEKLYLEEEIDAESGFAEIIGQSKALQTVMENVRKVAGSDATVLLLGETGTGKELVARAIHRLSRRAGNSFIKMNCAAIPSGLLESELFGNEKGAFTGAVSKKIGRLELADKGTLFLDEIGEISLALQPKLLRVLQDQEFERLGGTQTLKVDFRLIAATNRDLADSVRENEFRSDLYYRLNVFPIRVPPLRERREDIPLLVEHFVRRFASRMNRPIASIPKKTMEALVQWHWLGNVRELENFIERSVILTQGSVLAAPISELMNLPEARAPETLRAAEREHVLRVLRESHGRLSGPNGAAARLGLPRSTLQAKLKQLGIERQYYRG